MLLEDAEGLIVAHTVRLPGLTLKKGRRLEHSDITALRKAGCASIVGARLEPGDVGEDEAAARMATAVRGDNLRAGAPFTGRCNLYATAAGVLVIEQGRLDAVNLIDEAVTVATLPPFDVVAERQMVATIKIIPYGVAGDVVAAAEAAARSGGPLLRVAPFRSTAVGLIQTELPGLRASIMDKTREALEARLARTGNRLTAELRCRHEEAAIAGALTELAAQGCRLLLIAGASATADRRDVVPAGIERAGGAVVHLGMPVEPGNLLVLGRLDEATPVVCMPGCARSPVLNGFDWVLQRLLAKVPVTRADVMRMGAGGFLKGSALALADVASRSQAPRERAREQADTPIAPTIAAVVLAAGQSRRMGGRNKLLEPIGGEAMVARVVRRVLESQCDRVVVVVGHEASRVRDCLRAFKVEIVENPDFAAGMSGSLRRGLEALGDDVDAALVCLGDMPWVAGADIDRLIAAFSPGDGRAICAAAHRGQRGNPVLWGRQYFAAMRGLGGDAGARELLARFADAVCEVEIDNEGVLRDVDVPATLAECAEV
jgi:molybdenum cofactor cytidylyltransferase